MKAKSLKKPSDEDRSRLKKSKSKKRKSQYSSSDSADSGRKKPRKLKELKKKHKKKPRRASTPPASSSYSSDYSISSCSTCEKRKGNRSRSPISRSSGKSKLRKERNGTSSKYKGRERGRSHRRSRSCSTCSSSSTDNGRSRSASRSRSPRRSKKVRKDREKDEKAQVLRQVYSYSEERDKVIPAYDDIVSPSKDEENKMQGSSKESEPVAEVSEKVVPEKTQNDATEKTGAVDVELILRQKALENFIKFHKVKKCGLSEDKSEPVPNEPNEKVVALPGAVATDKEREEPTLDEPTKAITDVDLKEKGEIIGDISARKPKLRSVIIIPTEREVSEDDTAIGTYSTYEVSNGNKEVPKHVEHGLDKVSEPNPSLNHDPSSPVAPGLRKDEVQHGIASGVETAGAQYEKKTFSRMHEGETVQVSYKVYIPKKAPALARRKLQRGEASTS